MRSPFDPSFPLSSSAGSASRYAVRWVAVLAIGWLAGCAISPPTPSGDQTAWMARQKELARLDHWQAVGRIGVVNGQDGWHANFQWNQQEPDYRIDLIGPLGQGRVLIQGNGRQVSLQTQDGRNQTAPDPDTLLEQSLGVRLPVDGLRYWIRGLPGPGPVTALHVDGSGRLTRLEQQGWTIDYPAYAPAPSRELPARITARRQDVSVKLVIEQWTL